MLDTCMRNLKPRAPQVAQQCRVGEASRTVANGPQQSAVTSSRLIAPVGQRTSCWPSSIASNWSSDTGACPARRRLTFSRCQSVLKCSRCSAADAKPGHPSVPEHKVARFSQQPSGCKCFAVPQPGTAGALPAPSPCTRRLARVPQMRYEQQHAAPQIIVACSAEPDQRSSSDGCLTRTNVTCSAGNLSLISFRRRPSIIGLCSAFAVACFRSGLCWG